MFSLINFLFFSGFNFICDINNIFIFRYLAVTRPVEYHINVTASGSSPWKRVLRYMIPTVLFRYQKIPFQSFILAVDIFELHFKFSLSFFQCVVQLIKVF